MTSHSAYKQSLVQHFWKYQQDIFPDWEKYFERPLTYGGRPPVFKPHAATYNILMEPDITAARKDQLVHEIPARERHRWFRSMTSSQAIAQSILGNLKVYDHLDYLTELSDDSDLPLFGDAIVTQDNFCMERSVDYLGEPRPTSLDGFVSGDYQVAIECKLTEHEVGKCSRPRLRKQDTNFEKDYCDGTYTEQRGRKSKCSLTEIGVLYWTYVPKLFKWQNDIEYNPCPLYKNYQLVRNILAACVKPDGTLSLNNGHVVLIYDERNPAFQRGGAGHTSFEEIRDALYEPSLLRRCSWQRIINHIRGKSALPWLTDKLEKKYGL